jgi:hypothetical protein
MWDAEGGNIMIHHDTLKEPLRDRKNVSSGLFQQKNNWVTHDTVVTKTVP